MEKPARYDLLDDYEEDMRQTENMMPFNGQQINFWTKRKKNIKPQNLQESIQWTYCSNGSLFKEDRDVWSCCNGR